MTLHLGDVPANSTLYIPFASYNSAGASVTLTGLAATDIEIYKNGSTTQRASDAGYTLLDTDGIDFDGITGLHGFSVDLSDNTDAGFYSVGGFYWIVVSTVTIDSQTVTFIAATFRIVAAEAIAGKPKVDVDAWLGTAAATPTVAGVPEVDVTHFGGSAGTFASGRPETNINAIANNAITAAAIATGAIDADAIADNAIDAGAIAANAITSAKFAAGAITATVIATDAIDADALAADAVTEIQSGLSTLTAGQVNAEVVDALATDTYAEPTGVPGATVSLAAKIGRLYMALRNQVDVTSTKKTFYDDGGAPEWEQDLSDDGTTYSQSEANAI